MNDIERISKETAARLVTTQDYPSGTRFEVLIGGIMASVASWRQPADEQVAQFRHAIAAEIEVALRTPPGDSPVSAERLDGVRELRAARGAWGSRTADECIDDLLAHIDHQARLIRWLMGEPEGEDAAALLRQARLAGRAEQKAACALVARAEYALQARQGWDSPGSIVKAVEKAEVTDDG